MLFNILVCTFVIFHFTYVNSASHTQLHACIYMQINCIKQYIHAKILYSTKFNGGNFDKMTIIHQKLFIVIIHYYSLYMHQKSLSATYHTVQKFVMKENFGELNNYRLWQVKFEKLLTKLSLILYNYVEIWRGLVLSVIYMHVEMICYNS